MEFSVPICILLCTVLGHSFVSGQTGNRGLYVLNFMNISTDRTVNVLQVLDISSIINTKVRLYIPAINEDIYLTLDDANDHRYQQTFDRDLGVPRGEFISQSGALLVSDQATPFWVHANKLEVGTTAGYLALPVTQHATEFFVPSYAAQGGFHTGFSVAGLQDGTCVEIYVVNGDDYQRLALIHLDALDVYSALENMGSTDYTGVFVNSTRPLAVFGGHECARIPLGVDYCDAIVEQIPPVVEWGTEFIIGPIAGRRVNAQYEYRVIASDNDTKITYSMSAGTGGSAESGLTTLERGQFFSRLSPATDSNGYITCSKRCLVAQYNRGKEVVSMEIVDTDPFMMIVPPITHYDKSFRFVTMQHFAGATISDSENYITIVARTPATAGIRLDGAQLLGPIWTPVEGEPDYSSTTTGVSHGNHILSHTTDDEEYMAWVYGHGTSNTAYGYMAAYKINDDAVMDSGLYDVVEPTTQAPSVTQQSWVLGNWTEDFSSAELPQYGIRFAGNFSVINREQKIIEKVCSEGYRKFFMERRLTSMADRMTSQITNICSGVDGSTVHFTATSDEMFYSEYTRGFFSFIAAIVGSPTTTFRQVQQCSTAMRTYINDLSNWPPLVTEVPGEDAVANDPTTAFNFLQRDGDDMADCDPVKLGILSTEAEFHVVIEAWICNGLDPEEILRVIDGASLVTTATVAQLLAVSLGAFFCFIR